MKLSRRPKPKKNQAMDALASVAKTWSEWHLAERAGKGVAKGAKKAKELRGGKPSGIKRAVTGTPAKIAGGAAVLAGIGAAVARKLKGGSDTDPGAPGPHEPAPAPPPAAPPPPSSPLAAAPEPPTSAKAKPPTAAKAKPPTAKPSDGAPSEASQAAGTKDEPAKP